MIEISVNSRSEIPAALEAMRDTDAFVIKFPGGYVHVGPGLVERKKD